VKRQTHYHVCIRCLYRWKHAHAPDDLYAKPHACRRCKQNFLFYALGSRTSANAYRRRLIRQRRDRGQDQTAA
jgi:hypothetical protein